MPHIDPEQLALLALGEPDGGDPSTGEEPLRHLDTCARCRAGYEELRRVVDLGREVEDEDLALPPPPTRVWDGIVGELAGSDAPVTRAPAIRTRITTRRRVLLTLAACVAGVLIGVGATLGVQALNRTDPAPVQVVAATPLRPVAGAPSDLVGTARVVRLPGRTELEIDARNLPLSTGFYEAWMFVPDTTRMTAMGTLVPGMVNRFVVPPGLDPARWPGIDVSLEEFDGNPAHSATSVLRGELRR